MTTTTTRQDYTIRRLTVAHVGATVSADGVTDDGNRLSVQSYDRLPGFLASHVVPAGTPVYRFDLASSDDALRFAVRGPMPDVMLEPGTYSPPFTRAPMPWSPDVELSSLAYVSLDVYDTLARAAGIPVETTA